MPMAPAAIKWADASKFTMLARPLGKMETPGSPFMIEMEPPGMYLDKICILIYYYLDTRFSSVVQL